MTFICAWPALVLRAHTQKYTLMQFIYASTFSQKELTDGSDCMISDDDKHITVTIDTCSVYTSNPILLSYLLVFSLLATGYQQMKWGGYNICIKIAIVHACMNYKTSLTITITCMVVQVALV